VGLATNDPNRIQHPIFAEFTQSRSVPVVRALFVPAINQFTAIVRTVTDLA
jgi:hypothetical protein